MDRSKQLDEALDAMLGGSEVEPRDPEVRELVRVAYQIHDQREELTPERKEALKARILRRLDLPPRPTLRERFADSAGVLGRPLPLILRSSVALGLLAMFAAATIASADSLPDDSLYAWKLATEQVRLALAQSPGDRASVELSIAEHRLSEAEALVQRSRDAEADVAASEFGEHLAVAAATLEDARETVAPGLVGELRARVAGQEGRLAASQQSVAGGARSSSAVTVIAQVVTKIRASETVAAATIADAAASGAERAAAAASQRVTQSSADVTPPTARPGSSPASSPRTSPSARAATAKPTLSPQERAKAEQAARAAKESAQRARDAADRAKQAAQRSPLPKRP